MPYDPEQTQRQAAEQRQAERESAARQKAAGTSPTKSTGGKGWISGASGSGSDKAADAPGKYDGGLSGGVVHSEAVEQNIRDKAIGGGVITNDDIGEAHGYLGHFSGDSVLAKGHNAGHKKVGKTPLVRTVAKAGFRKLPGSASPQQGNARFGTMSEAALGLRPSRAQRQQDAKSKAAMTRSANKVMLNDPVPLSRTPMGGFGAPRAVSDQGGKMPPTPADKKMSIRHHEDSIKYNKKHMVDHERAMLKHERELKKVERSARKKSR